MTSFGQIQSNGAWKMSFGKSEIWTNFAHTSDAGNASHSYTSATYICKKTLLWDLFFCKNHSDRTRIGEMASILVSKTCDFRPFCPLFGIFWHFLFDLFFSDRDCGQSFWRTCKRYMAVLRHQQGASNGILTSSLPPL